MTHISSWCKGVSPQPSFQWNSKHVSSSSWNKNGKAAVLTSGGNCPGINYVLHCLERESPRPLTFFQNGFNGLNEDIQTVPDTYASSLNIGSAIGMSRKRISVKKSINTLCKHNISNLYIVGGNGSATAASLLHNEIVKLKLPICVNLIPKTIDNDIPMIDKTFGFDSAVAHCSNMIHAAHTEAYINQEISIIQLMGRKSGALALHAAYASPHYDILLLPEHPHDHSVIVKKIKDLYNEQQHVTIVLSEGYHSKEQRTSYLVKLYNSCQQISIRPKLFVPTYLCRNTPVCTSDKIFIKQLVHHIVFASENGYGGSCIGTKQNNFILANLNEIKFRSKQLYVSDPLFQEYLDINGLHSS